MIDQTVDIAAAAPLTLVQLVAGATCARLPWSTAAAVAVPGLLSDPPPHAVTNAAAPMASKVILLPNALMLISSKDKY